MKPYPKKYAKQHGRVYYGSKTVQALLGTLEKVDTIFVDKKINRALDDESINTLEDFKNAIVYHFELSKKYHEEKLSDILRGGFEIPELVLYEERSIDTPCGKHKQKVGPMYCVENKTLYFPVRGMIDIMKKYYMYGDMSIAFIVGHEMQHHVQSQIMGNQGNLLNFLEYLKNKLPKENFDAEKILEHFSDPDPQYLYHMISFLERDSDYGCGGYVESLHLENLLVERDLQEVYSAAKMSGSDHINLVNGSYTTTYYQDNHGTSEQRAEALKAGFKNKGDYALSPLVDFFRTYAPLK